MAKLADPSRPGLHLPDPRRLVPDIERMEGVDAGYLYMETPSMHMHTLKIGIIEAAPDVTFEHFSAGVLKRLQRMPILRRRVVPVPLAMNHPLWVTHENVDPARHLFRHRVPGAGSMTDLEKLIGEIASTPLRRNVPLWELHYCEGLADGLVAVVGKVHHSVADGAAANALLAKIADVHLDTEPEDGDEPEGRGGLGIPGPWTILRDALVDAARQAGLLPRLIGRTLRGLRSMFAFRRTLLKGRGKGRLPRPILDVPRVSFNGPLTAERAFATCSVPLDRVKRVRQGHPGVTLNDVVLAIVSGALRFWLEGRGEQPASSLVAGVPVSTDEDVSPPRMFGNRLSNLFTSLATDVDDPRERLLVISEVTAHAKQIQARLGPTMLTDWVQFTPPAPFRAAMRLYSHARAAAWHRAPFNLVVSNVPGPREELTIGGARVTDLFSVGPILEGIGLNVTVWSYVDRMNFSLLACPKLLADPAELAAYFPAALEELERTVA